MVLGQIISLFGSAIQRFCMSLYLLEFTGSTAAFANILAISTLPYIFMAPIAGRLSDNVNRKKIMVWLDFICSLIIAGYAVILLQGKDQPWIVATVMFLLSVGATLYGPAVTASIPQIVKEESLTRANGIVNQVSSIVNFAGPILAGVLYGIMGIKLIVIINAISFGLSAIMELFLDIPDVKERTGSVEHEVREIEGQPLEQLQDQKKVGVLGFVAKSFIDMKANFLYLKKEKKVVLGIIASYAMGNLFLVPILSIVAPYFINIKLGLPSEVYGIVEGVCVLGMILGGFIISVKPERFKIGKVHLTFIPMILGVILLAVIAMLRTNALTLAVLFAIGGLLIMLSLALSNVVTLTFIQKGIPLELLGSVSAFSTAVATISVAPGQLLFGQLIETGMPLGFLMSLVALANIGVVAFIRWNVRNV